MARTTKRRPRFRRNAEVIGTIELTLRDKKIIHYLGLFRFLRSTQIFKLVGGGRFPLLRRLQALFLHGWLERPRSQIDYHHRGGSCPMVYGLSGKGAALATRELGMAQGWRRWRGEKSAVGRLFLDHTLMIADVLITVESAGWEAERGVLFIAPHTLEAESASKDGFHWSVWLEGIAVGLVPDAVFAVERMCMGGVRERMVCFLEADRGTMPIRRTDKHQSSVGRKLSAYATLWKNGTFSKQFGTGRFAVFLVTPGKERARTLSDAVSDLREGKGLFSCHTLEEVMADPGVIYRRFAGRDRKS